MYYHQFESSAFIFLCKLLLVKKIVLSKKVIFILARIKLLKTTCADTPW